jgi:hypothetical protein
MNLSKPLNRPSPRALAFLPLREAWKDSLVRGLLFVSPFAFALDFKGEQSGTIWQMLMAVGAVGVFVFLCIFGVLAPTRASLKGISWSAVAIGTGVITAYVLDVPFEQLGRMVLPYGLFFAGLWAGSIAGNDQKTAWTLICGMAVAGVLSLFFRYFYSTRVAGLDLSAMRYQIITPAISTLIAFVSVSFCYVQRIRQSAILISAAVVAVIGISITRTYLLTIVALICSLVFLLWRLSRRNSLHNVYKRSRRIGLIVVVFGGLVGLGVAAVLRKVSGGLFRKRRRD